MVSSRKRSEKNYREGDGNGVGGLYYLQSMDEDLRIGVVVVEINWFGFQGGYEC